MTCTLVSPEALASEQVFALSGDAAHHLRDVLRVRKGDSIRLVDGIGNMRSAYVEACDRHTVFLRPESPCVRQPSPPVEITLFQCVAKPARMDWLLEKVSELGVSRLVPILSAHTVSRLPAGETPDRWQRILDSALCQCNAAWKTQLLPLCSWADAYARMQNFPGPILVASLAEKMRPVLDALREREQTLSAPPQVGILIGPEGDFSPEELSQAIALPNAAPVTLGNRVLRVETAAVTAAAITLSFFSSHRF